MTHLRRTGQSSGRELLTMPALDSSRNCPIDDHTKAFEVGILQRDDSRINVDHVFESLIIF